MSRRLRTALAATALVALVVAALAYANADAAGATPSVVVTTQNVRYTLGPARAGHDLRQAQRGSDLVLTQEMGSRHASRFALPGYGVVQPRDRHARELAIYFRRSTTRYVGLVPLVLHTSTLFGSATRDALAALFRHNGRCLLVVDVHMIPHIEQAGRPRRLPRLALVDRGLDRVVAFARMTRCAAIVGGDWNVDGYADRRVRSPVFPAARFAALGFASDWAIRAGPTLGRRHVDGMFYRNARPVSRRILTGTYSDHNGSRSRVKIG